MTSSDVPSSVFHHSAALPPFPREYSNLFGLGSHLSGPMISRATVERDWWSKKTALLDADIDCPSSARFDKMTRAHFQAYISHDRRCRKEEEA